MKKRIICALLVILLVMLSGCGAAGIPNGFFQTLRGLFGAVGGAQAEMDDLLVQIMTFVEEGDAEGLAAISEDPQAVRQIFPAVTEYWPAKRTDPFECAEMNYRTGISGGEKYKIASAVYVVHSGEEDFQVDLEASLDEEKGNVIRVFHIVSEADLIAHGMSLPKSGEDASALSAFLPRTQIQWVLRVAWLLMLGFCIFTIIDIIRKKPRKYGLWILLALVFAALALVKDADGFQIRFNVFLLTTSEWIENADGTAFYQISVPLGAILYWIRRRKLMEKKAQTQGNAPVLWQQSPSGSFGQQESPAQPLPPVPPEGE